MNVVLSIFFSHINATPVCMRACVCACVYVCVLTSNVSAAQIEIAAR